MRTSFTLFILAACFYLLYGQQSEKLELIDVFELKYVSDPQISPDGSKIAYVRNFKDIMKDKNLSNIWVVDFDGKNHQPVTSGNQNDLSPVWSPDGTRIIYRSNKDGSSQLYLYWLSNGAEVKISHFTEPPSNVSWSPSGKYIAFTMFVPEAPSSLIQLPAKPRGAVWSNPPVYIEDLKFRSDGSGYTKPGNNHIFIMSSEGGSARQVSKGENSFGAPIWGHDESSLFFSANLHEDRNMEPGNSEIYKIDIASGEITALTSRKGPDSSPVLSHDGKWIAYSGYDEEYHGYQVRKLYIMRSNGTDHREVTTTLDRDVSSFAWLADHQSLLIQYDDRGNTVLARVNVTGQTSILAKDLGGLALGRPYSGATFSASSTGHYAYTYGPASHPSDLSSGKDGKNNRLTALNSDLFSYKIPGKVEELWWKSSFDQRDIQGWICYPPNFKPEKKYPMILEIHGGPFANYGNRYSAEIQLFAAAGYVVLYTNPRGSTSYGKEFGNLIHHNYPSEDYDDMMSGVDALIDKGFIDEDNLFITGGSGGGVLTAWTISKTNRFRAAVVAKPVINWFSFVLYADNPAFFYRYWFPGFPWDHLDHYMSRSPIYHVASVSTPTMLLTGEEDYRTPIAESEQYYTALKLKGVDAALVRVQGASHGIADTPSNLIAKVAYILGWFEKYKVK
ncbi:MAG TPA: S9 family peptidase [Saprospiraceae bacterium]|nr:S9 family peptidase [Saprospiraceae bacterium]